MSVAGPATAIEKVPNEPEASRRPAPGRNFRLWLRVWLQVVIAELLHLTERRSSSGARW